MEQFLKIFEKIFFITYLCAALFTVNLKNAKADAYEQFHKEHVTLFTSPYDQEAINAKENTAVIVGGGPAGLAAAIALKKSHSFDHVVVLEKREVYTRNQVANITKYALLSMIDLEPRILTHLLEIGRSFFFDEHILLDLDPSFPTKKIDMRPFQKTLAKILRKPLPKPGKRIHSLSKPKRPLRGLNSSLLESEKLAAAKIFNHEWKAEDPVFACPINDMEHALNFIAINYYGVSVQKSDVDWQAITKELSPDLFIDATGSANSLISQRPHRKLSDAHSVKTYATEDLMHAANLARVDAESYSWISENNCNLFPWMFYDKQEEEAYKTSRENGASRPRFDTWESVFHTIEDINPKSAKSTVTVKTDPFESFTFIVMPQHHLTFELRPNAKAFLRRKGLEFTSLDEAYVPRNYQMAEKELESHLHAARAQSGRRGRFIEYFPSDDPRTPWFPYSYDKNAKQAQTIPIILVGDTAYRPLAYQGLGLSNCFSIYANTLSKGLEKPFIENYHNNSWAIIGVNREKSLGIFGHITATPFSMDKIPEKMRHDLTTFANDSDELDKALEIIAMAERLMGEKPESRYTDYKHLKQWPLLGKKIADIKTSNRQLSTRLERFIDQTFSFDQDPIHKHRLSKITDPLSYGLQKQQGGPQVTHLKQFHYSSELTLPAKIIDSQTIEKQTTYIYKFISRLALGHKSRTSISNIEPNSETILCAAEKFRSAFYLMYPSEEDYLDTTSYVHRAYMLKDFLYDALLQLMSYLEFSPRFDLIIESQRKMLINLFNKFQEGASMAIVEEGISQAPKDELIELIKKTFKHWTPGEETLAQAHLLFYHGAGVVMHALTEVPLFPANSQSINEEVQSSVNENPRKDERIEQAFLEREADTFQKIQGIANKGYQDIYLIYGEAHDFSPYFEGTGIEFQAVETVKQKDHIEFFKLQGNLRSGYSLDYLNRKVPDDFIFDLSHSCTFTEDELPEFDDYRKQYTERLLNRPSIESLLGHAGKLRFAKWC